MIEKVTLTHQNRHPNPPPLAGEGMRGAERSEAGEGRYIYFIYFAATGMLSSAYISGSTVSRHVISRGKIFSMARAE